MTPVPKELVELRGRTAASYRYRKPNQQPLTPVEHAALPSDERKGWQWQADPQLIGQLCAAEHAWTRKLARRREVGE